MYIISFAFLLCGAASIGIGLYGNLTFGSIFEEQGYKQALMFGSIIVGGLFLLASVLSGLSGCTHYWLWTTINFFFMLFTTLTFFALGTASLVGWLNEEKLMSEDNSPLMKELNAMYSDYTNVQGKNNFC